MISSEASICRPSNLFATSLFARIISYTASIADCVDSRIGNPAIVRPMKTEEKMSPVPEKLSGMSL